MKTVIPEGPWTVEKLGWDLYVKLANEHNVLIPSKDFHPALDLTAEYNEQQAAHWPMDAEKPSKSAKQKDGE